MGSIVHRSVPTNLKWFPNCSHAHALFQARFKDVQVGSRWFSTLYILSPNFHILYKKQSGTQREKKHVLTLTLMLVRRKSACKTSAGSSKILRWLTPRLGPNLDPKTRPKQRPKRRNENVIQFWTPFWGPYLDPKMGSPIGEFRCCPHMLCKQICDPAA